MNIRQELQPGFILDFPGMPCRIDETLGMGSNAIVYKGSYCDRLYPEERHHVFIKELFPFHPEGSIRRGEDNRICIEGDEALAFYKMHKESFEEGNRIHLRLLENAPEGLGANLNADVSRLRKLITGSLPKSCSAQIPQNNAGKVRRDLEAGFFGIRSIEASCRMAPIEQKTHKC